MRARYVLTLLTAVGCVRAAPKMWETDGKDINNGKGQSLVTAAAPVTMTRAHIISPKHDVIGPRDLQTSSPAPLAPLEHPADTRRQFNDAALPRAPQNNQYMDDMTQRHDQMERGQQDISKVAQRNQYMDEQGSRHFPRPPAPQGPSPRPHKTQVKPQETNQFDYPAKGPVNYMNDPRVMQPETDFRGGQDQDMSKVAQRNQYMDGPPAPQGNGLRPSKTQVNPKLTNQFNYPAKGTVNYLNDPRVMEPVTDFRAGQDHGGPNAGQLSDFPVFGDDPSDRIGEMDTPITPPGVPLTPPPIYNPRHRNKNPRASPMRPMSGRARSVEGDPFQMPPKRERGREIVPRQSDRFKPALSQPMGDQMMQANNRDPYGAPTQGTNKRFKDFLKFIKQNEDLVQEYIQKKKTPVMRNWNQLEAAEAVGAVGAPNRGHRGSPAGAFNLEPVMPNQQHKRGRPALRAPSPARAPSRMRGQSHSVLRVAPERDRNNDDRTLKKQERSQLQGASSKFQVRKDAGSESDEHTSTLDPIVLDMAPAHGAAINEMRAKGRICQRQVLLPEGPKYDSKGVPYLAAFKPLYDRDFPDTRAPRILMPICCNCCQKSVLGCE